MAEWTLCKDALPEKDGKYLVCKNIGLHDTVIQEVVSFTNNLEEVDDYDSEWGFYECCGVFAWMPLPAPPKMN